jgi:toxin ParE1/3/4
MRGARQVIVSDAAASDLVDIWRYSAVAWSIAQAGRYVDDLERTFETLREMPDLGRERHEFSPPVRTHPTGEHIVVYLTERDDLRIVRVLAARQNWWAILSE